jgi:hypothetical protein
VHGPGTKPQKKLPPLLYLFLLMVGFSVFIYLPTHLLLQAMFGQLRKPKKTFDTEEADEQRIRADKF